MRGLYGHRQAALALAAAIAVAPHAARAQSGSPVVIEGVADKTQRESIKVILPAREAPKTLFDAERISEEAAERVRIWLRAEGYYAGTVQAIAEDGPPRARLKVELGPVFTFVAPRLVYDGAPPSAEAQKAVQTAIGPIIEGAPARAGEVLSAEVAAISALRDHGYSEAKANDRKAVVDHIPRTMAVTLHLSPGPLVRLGAVRAAKPGLVKPKFLRRLADWREGDLYAPEKLTKLRKDLSATGAFSRVEVRLDKDAEAGEARDVIVRLAAAKRHQLELGGSYSTTEGAGANAEWTIRNLSGRADSLTYAANIAENQQDVQARWLLPDDAGDGRARRYTIALSHDATQPYDKSGLAVAMQTEARVTAPRAFTYGVSASADFYSKSAGVDRAYVLSTFGQYRIDTADLRFDPHTGYILDGRLEPAVSTGDATVAFITAKVDARRYYSPASFVTLAGRTRLGWVTPLSGSTNDLPLDRLFYAGGGGSVRGYEYQSIYPGAPLAATEPPGGRGLLEVSAEARFRLPRNFGLTMFVDGGNAFDNWGDSGDLKWSAGIGFRYDLGFAPIRFDVAVPLDRRPQDAPVAFYISLGQAF